MENTSLATPSSSSAAFDISALNLSSELNQYVLVAKTGTTVTQYPFERLKFESNRQQRFAILTSDVVIVKRHYHETLGYVLSDGGKIDSYFDKAPSIVYTYPVVHYTDCSDKGKPLSDKIQVKMLVASKDVYNFLCSLYELKGDLTQFDFLGSLIPGSDKFPKTQLLEAGSPALWTRNPSNREYIQEYMKQNGDRYLSAVGKIMTPAKIEEELGLSSSTSSVPAIGVDQQDLDDIFKPVE